MQMKYWPALYSVWYVDGQRLPEELSHNWATAWIAASTQVIAVKATDGRCDGYNHVWIRLGNGEVTDNSWKCTVEAQQNDDWTRVDFDDSTWPDAVHLRFYEDISVIWTDCCSRSVHCPVAYCRKVIRLD